MWFAAPCQLAQYGFPQAFLGFISFEVFVMSKFLGKGDEIVVSSPRIAPDRSV
jgi:hypothetical protein